MYKCLKCGHYTMVYSTAYEKWECYCQYYIYKNPKPEDCHCDHTIPESYESYNKRLRDNNFLGRYYVEPP